MAALHLLAVAVIMVYARLWTVCGQGVSLYLGPTNSTPISNNSFVPITDIGVNQEQGLSLECRTELDECCGATQTEHRERGLGWWFFPDGTPVLDYETYSYRTHSGNRFDMTRGSNGVHLNRRKDPKGPTGMFYCVIPDINGTNQTLYVYVTKGRNATIEIIHTGSNNIGGQYRLTCTVKGVSSRFLEWFEPDNLSSMIDTTDKTPSSIVLKFDPLQVSHIGWYGCRYSINGDTQEAVAAVRVKGIHLSLNGSPIPNNSYIPITNIEEDKNGLLCITDNFQCCKQENGGPLGEWYFPDNTIVGIYNDGGDIYRNRSFGVVRLNRRNNALSPTGLYRCEVPDDRGNNHTINVNIVNVLLNHIGNNTAGEQYRLLCSVDGVSGTTLIPFQWRGPDNTAQTTATNLSPTISAIQFDPLQLSHEGMYTCRATLPNGVVVSASQIIRPAAIFQIRFNGLQNNCSMWILNFKRDIIANTLVTAVERECQCGFTRGHITKVRFWCFSGSETHVTFRAKLSSNGLQVTTSQLLSHIQYWISTTSFIEVQTDQLEINSTCDTIITNFESPECTLSSSSSPGLPLTIVIAAAASSGGLLLLSCGCLIAIAIVIKRRRRAKDKKSCSSTTTSPSHDRPRRNTFGMSSNLSYNIVRKKRKRYGGRECIKPPHSYVNTSSADNTYVPPIEYASGNNRTTANEDTMYDDIM